MEAAFSNCDKIVCFFRKYAKLDIKIENYIKMCVKIKITLLFLVIICDKIEKVVQLEIIPN